MNAAFDYEKLMERRIKSGHSVRSLAGHLGVSPATVRSVEGGTDPNRYEYGLLCRYADALGLRIDQLFITHEPTSPEGPDDAAQVVALVVAAGGVVQLDALASVLEWAPERVRVAVDQAAVVVPAVGLRVVWFGDSAVELLPDAELVEPAKELLAKAVDTHGLKRDAARLVWQLAVNAKRSRAANQIVADQLVDVGLAVYAKKSSSTAKPGSKHGTRAALTLTKAARYNLCLDTEL